MTMFYDTKPAIVHPAPEIFIVLCPYCQTVNNSPNDHATWSKKELWETNDFHCVGCEEHVDIPFIDENQAWLGDPDGSGYSKKSDRDQASKP